MILFIVNFLLISCFSVCRECLAHSASCCVGACLCAYNICLVLSSTAQILCCCSICDPFLYPEESTPDTYAWDLFADQIRRTHDFIAPPQQTMTTQRVDMSLPRMLGNGMQTSRSLGSQAKPRLIYTASPISFVNEECAICLEYIGNDKQFVILECKHRFHQECFEKWVLRNLSCPNCRKIPKLIYLQ